MLVCVGGSRVEVWTHAVHAYHLFLVTIEWIKGGGGDNREVSLCMPFTK